MPAQVSRPVVIQRLVTLTVIQAVFAAAYTVLRPGIFTAAVFGPIVLVLLAAAYGLHQMTPWGRILGICLAVSSLLGVPLGTILGIFLLIYYFKPEVKAAFAATRSPAEQQLARAAVNLWKPLATLLGVFNIILILVLILTAVAILLPRIAG